MKIVSWASIGQRISQGISHAFEEIKRALQGLGNPPFGFVQQLNPAEALAAVVAGGSSAAALGEGISLMVAHSKGRGGRATSGGEGKVRCWNRWKIEKVVKRIIEKEMGELLSSTITLKSRLSDLGVDPFYLEDITTAIENYFKSRGAGGLVNDLEWDEMMPMDTTVGRMVNVIAKFLRSQGRLD